MFEEMFKDKENTSMDHGVRLTCTDESVFSALAHYYSHVEEYESLCGMPVRLFYPEVEQEHETPISMDEVSWRNTVLLSDMQVRSIPSEVLKEQDVLCVYRTDSEENFVACAERLTALQKDGSDQCARPSVLCFTDADSAKAYICGSGLWAPRQSQVVGATWDDVFTASCIDKGESAMDLGRISPVRGATVSEWSSTGGTADLPRFGRSLHVRSYGKIGSHRRLFCRWGQCSMAD